MPMSPSARASVVRSRPTMAPASAGENSRCSLFRWCGSAPSSCIFSRKFSLLASMLSSLSIARIAGTLISQGKRAARISGES